MGRKGALVSSTACYWSSDMETENRPLGLVSWIHE